MHPKMTAMVLLAGALLFPGAARGADEVQDVLAKITREMKGITSVQVEFVEEKTMAFFSAPVILRGSLCWERPDSLAWRVATPVQYAMIMRRGTMRQWEGDQQTVQEFSLNANPVMRVASQQLQRWFSGNYSQLAEEYAVTVVGRQPLTLACVPRPDSAEAGFIQRVTIQFQNDLRYIARIGIEEISGDLTSIRFGKSRLNEAIPESAWRAGAAGPHD